MNRRYLMGLALALGGLSGIAGAQIVPPIGGVSPVDLPRVGLPGMLADLDRLSAGTLARTLAVARLDRIAAFVRNNRGAVEFDADNQPAVRGVLIATGIDDAGIAAAQAAGYSLIARETIDGLDMGYARFAVPDGKSLAAGEKALRKLIPAAEIDADNIYFASGSPPRGGVSDDTLATASAGKASLGMIDGGVANHASVAGRVEQRGFASGAPRASTHGTSVAALMVGSGAVRGSAPGAPLLAADVYGGDPAGGNASAIARALGWLASRGVAVVTISLVGPDNALLRQAVRAAQGKGMIVVAAVGNDGPAAPPGFPASYPGVLAITGVDPKNRLLPEAGRTRSVAFAAPASGFASATGADSVAKVRGTSFAAPLVAGRLARHYPRPSVPAVEGAVRALIAEAVDLGRKGSDADFGHGLVCGSCVARK